MFVNLYTKKEAARKDSFFLSLWYTDYLLTKSSSTWM